MAAPHSQIPFSPYEKTIVLAEIIKVHAPNPEYLLQFAINTLGPQQVDWNNIVPPPGRTVNQCAHAFGELRRSNFPQPSPMMRPMPPQSTSPMSAGPTGVKRPFQQYSFESTGPYPPGREIRPKQSLDRITSIGQQSSLEQPPKKKRGRPTKAEAQARDEARVASGEPGPASRPQSIDTPIARPSVALPLEPPTSEPTIESTRPEEARQPLPQPQRMSVSSMLTPTGPKNASQSSSSSGKRRRGKSTRSEPEDMPRVEETSSTQAQEYESPYTRFGAEAQDSPARAAVLRHRDDPTTQSPDITTEETLPTIEPPTTGPT